MHDEGRDNDALCSCHAFSLLGMVQRGEENDAKVGRKKLSPLLRSLATEVRCSERVPPLP